MTMRLPMNRPGTGWPSGRWTCRSMRRLPSRVRVHSGRARSVFGCLRHVIRVGLRPTPRLRRLREPLRPAPLPRSRPTSSRAQPRRPDSPSCSRARLPDRSLSTACESRSPICAWTRRRAGSSCGDSSTSADEDPRLDLHGRLDADLARAARRIPVSLTPSAASGDSDSIRGTLELVLTARGSVASPTLDLSATGREVVYGPLQSVRFTTRSSLDANRIRVHQLDVSSPSGSLQASGEIALAGTVAHDNSGSARSEPSRLVVGWTDVDPDRALVSAGYALPTSIGARASGRAELRLDSTAASVADLLSRLAVDASVKLQPIPDEPRRGAGLALGGQAQLRLKDGSWSVRHSLTASSSTASLAGTVSGRYRPDRRRRSAAARGSSRRCRPAAAAWRHWRLDSGAIPPSLERLARFDARTGRHNQPSGRSRHPCGA